MAYDSQRGQCVAFGGWDAPTGNIVFQDTWEYDGSNWVLRTPATVPNERESHMMAYDSARGRTVMFGGWDFNFALLGETWEWDGTNWVDRMPATAPSARLLGAAAFDIARGRDRALRWARQHRRRRGHVGVGWHELDPGLPRSLTDTAHRSTRSPTTSPVRAW